MKKLSIIFLFHLFLMSHLIAKAPNKISYQAIVRDVSGQLLMEQPIGIKVTLLQGSITGSQVYSETFSSSTNTNGLITIEIGTGTTSGSFSEIDWSKGPYYVSTDIDPEGGTNYSISTTTQLLSVPFSLFANTAQKVIEVDGQNSAFANWDKNALDDFSGDYNALSNKPNKIMYADTAEVAKALVIQSEGGKTFELTVDENGNLSTIELVGSTLTDKDGNSYPIVRIGTQYWMAENLKTTTYNDGTAISNVTDNAIWTNLTIGAYCWFNDDIANKEPHGALYNRYAVETGKLCPEGYHVPNNEEWETLIEYLGGMENAGGKLKETGTALWQSPNNGATNESGFTAIPGGYRATYGFEAEFFPAYAYLWSTSNSGSDADCFVITNYYKYVSYTSFPKNYGNSVRCIKD